MTFSQSDLSILSHAHCINALQGVVNANFWLKSQQNVGTQYIRESVDSLYRDDTDEISRDPRTKRLKTR